MAKNPLDFSDDEISNMSEAPLGEKPEGDISSGSGEIEQENSDSGVEATDDASKQGHEDQEDNDDAADEDDEDDGDDDSSDGDGSDDAGDSGESILSTSDEKLHEQSSDKKAADSKAADTVDKTKSADTGDKEKLSEKEDKKEIKEVDYKAEYEKIMSPIKANGKTIKLDNPEEVIKLMQMGANYTKKMQALQPHIKLVKMLEKNAIDEDKLNLLIDLDKKDPEAIRKFFKDSIE